MFDWLFGKDSMKISSITIGGKQTNLNLGEPSKGKFESTNINLVAVKNDGVEYIASEVEYIVSDILRNSPDIVLFTDGSLAGTFLNILEQKIIEPYEVFVNEKCSLKWLCNATKLIRGDNTRKAILISNYPRNLEPPTTYFTTHIPGKDVISRSVSLKDCSLSLRDTTDMRSLAIYVPTLTATGYLNNIFKLQSHGKENLTRFQMIVPAYRTGSSRSFLESSNDLRKNQQILRQITDEIETHPDYIGYSGGILMD